jgi:hypothetical protein
MNEQRNIYDVYTESPQYNTSSLKDIVSQIMSRFEDVDTYPFIRNTVNDMWRPNGGKDRWVGALPRRKHHTDDGHKNFEKQYPWLIIGRIQNRNLGSGRGSAPAPRVFPRNSRTGGEIVLREVAIPAWMDKFVRYLITAEDTLWYFKNDVRVGHSSDFQKFGKQTGLAPIVDMSRCQILAYLFYVSSVVHNIHRIMDLGGHPGIVWKQDIHEDDPMEKLTRIVDGVRNEAWRLFDQGYFTGHTEEYKTAGMDESSINEVWLDHLINIDEAGDMHREEILIHNYTSSYDMTEPKGYRLHVPGNATHPSSEQAGMSSFNCNEEAVAMILGGRDDFYHNTSQITSAAPELLEDPEFNGVGFEFIKKFYIPRLLEK